MRLPLTRSTFAIASMIALAAAAQTPSAMPSPTTAPATRPIDAAWNDLAEPEPKASIALLELASDPDAFVAFAKDRLPPATLTKDELAKQLVALGSDDDATWHAASAYLRYFDPRLAVDLSSLMDDVADAGQRTRMRLVEILSEKAEGSLTLDVRLDESHHNFRNTGGTSWWAEPSVSELNEIAWVRGKPSWTRVVRGIVLLEHIGTPAARAIVDAMATGHPDAQPTRVARDLIAARTSRP